MGGVVVFNASDFRDVYPEFSALSDAALENVFDTSCLLVDNTPASPIPLTSEAAPREPRKKIIYLAMAHILELKKRGMDTVGTVTAATQGSVNVSFGTSSADNDDSFWAQTNYGRLFLRVTLPYRQGPLYVTLD